MNDAETRDQAEARLWQALEDTRVGMLGVHAERPTHMQPMTAFAERGANSLWFFTYRDTDLARDAGTGGRHAMFCLVSKDREIYACLGGELHLHEDRERMDRYWNPVVAAWYPEGKDDPRLTLLHMKLDDAEVWVSHAGPIRFAYEVAKANLTHDTPDVGERASVDFR